MDLACLVLGGVVGVAVRLTPEEVPDYVFGHLDGWLVFFGSVLLANYLAGSYRIQYTFSRFNLVVTWLFSLIFALFILSLTTYAWIRIVLGRGVLVLSIAVYSVAALTVKLLIYRRLFRSDRLLCRVLVLGSGTWAERVTTILENELVLPAHRVAAWVRLPGEPHGAATGGTARRPPVMDPRGQDLLQVIRDREIGLVVLAPDDDRQGDIFYPLLRRIRYEGVEVMRPLHVCEVYSGNVPVDFVNEETLMNVSFSTGFPIVSQAKRAMDIVIALVALLLFSPIVVVVSFLVKLSHPSASVFYRQTRVGQFGRPFTIFKFRTMAPDAESRTGPVWSAKGDARVTRLGSVLRTFRVDEIPQFVNVLRGEMSMVGPRPERPELIGELEKRIPYFSERLNVLPGLTGWAQVRYPYGSTIEDARRKLEYDLYYIKHLSLRLDLQIILSTLRVVVFGKVFPPAPGRLPP
jgi:exopolysaccharide biosynthesis polyprenyl glycosylphosphotransferase